MKASMFFCLLQVPSRSLKYRVHCGWNPDPHHLPVSCLALKIHESSNGIALPTS